MGAYNILEQIFDFKIGSSEREITIFLNPDLDKPAVSIINTQGIEQSIEDANKQGGSHWVAFIILPKNFKGILQSEILEENADIDYQTERIFLYDSLGLNIE